VNSTAPFTILVADDVESNRILLRGILKKQNFNVEEARDGRQALEKLETSGIDIALLDVLMPDIDGFSVCREVRKSRGPSDLPILFVTAKTDDRDLIAGLNAGGNDYLVKPVNAQILLARLDAQVRLLSAARALKNSYEQLEAKKRMATVGLFAAGVAHNFNNILGAIHGSAEVIQMASNNNEMVLKAADLILRAAKRGATLTDSLLTFTRSPSQEAVCIPSEIAQAAVTMLPFVTKDNVTLNLELDDPLPAIAISPGDLSQVLLELLRNSIDAIADSGEILVKAFCNPENPELVTFRIKDTGRGIKPERIPHIFEPFYSTKNLDSFLGISLDGSGLGLSSVYNLVHNAGGSIQVVESSSAGTIFEFSIPRAAARRAEVSSLSNDLS
jgi:signal transduction histidine kinase